MTDKTFGNWITANQDYLMASLAVARERLQNHGKQSGQKTDEKKPVKALQDTAASMMHPPALDILCETFGLSSFERDILLMCAGMELDSGFAAQCAAAQKNDRHSYPTFSLALAALPEANWNALSPTAPLRRWRLIEVGTGDTLTMSPLRIDEWVLHYLTGVWHLDERLVGIVEPLPDSHELVPSHNAVSRRIAALLTRPADTVFRQIIQLTGDEAGKPVIAASVGAALGIRMYSIRAEDIPSALTERESLSRLWEREAVLNGSGLLVECDDTDNAELTKTLLPFVENLQGMLIVTGRNPLRTRRRTVFHLEVKKPTVEEQFALWREAVSPMAGNLNGIFASLVSQFNFDARSILAAGAEALGGMEPDSAAPSVSPKRIEERLWDSCRSHARPRLDDLAHHIEPAAAWNDLVLPEPQRAVLKEITAHVRQRVTVYDKWGFAKKSSRGLGISALFAGPSGTGKTMAAEALAAELRLDLYRIDLSSVVSKYIGETEKNLRRVFDAAEEGGAILLFDEADALFGKRSEVKDSHDRYANVEVSYLLQRMETYRGLAILTTNMKNALDTAFLRRIRFVVQFPFPDAGQRAEIWRNIFPAETPTDGLDAEKLARLNVTGGNIRNIALNAAFLAADEAASVRMGHLLRAVRGEYAKLEKSLTEAEIGDW